MSGSGKPVAGAAARRRTRAQRTPRKRREPPAAAGTPRDRRLFDAMLGDRDEVLAATTLTAAIEQSGLWKNDPRLSEFFKSLRELERSDDNPAAALDFAEFSRVVKPNALIIERSLTRDFAIPDFAEFTRDVRSIFDRAAADTSGAVADYIPQLGRVNPEQFGAAICSIDGQRLAMGDSAQPFCVQSVSKAVSYCLALEEHGESFVHQHMGCEPSGVSFNALTLTSDGKPHNPLINAGGIMSSALIRRDLTIADRFDYVLDKWGRLAGGDRLGFNNATYLSERRTADRNFALGYSMREARAFPDGTDLIETLEFYFQCCSLETTVQTMSVVAATLANGGVCPLTGERVLRPETVQKCLSLMGSCGMYDYSGEWAFRIGLPAKSGVSGLILAVVPNVLGLCTWSPRLDRHGNSVRGIRFCEELVQTFNFHAYDNLTDGHHVKKDPRSRREQTRRNLLVDLCWAASEGDLNGIRRLLIQGVDLNSADYDGRTAMHLAASEGRSDVVALLLRHDAHVTPVDRWGNTPVDDAEKAGHSDVMQCLNSALAA